MQLFLAATPAQLHTARRFTPYLAHVAYAVEGTGGLSCSGLSDRVRGGLLLLSDHAPGALDTRESLAEAVVNECARRNFGGVVADFERTITPDRVAFLQLLCRALHASKRRLFVPERAGEAVDGAMVLLCTAISGGTLERRLRDAAARFGADRLALDAQRVRMDFLLPSPSGEGYPIDKKTLAAILREHSPQIFFSEALCARYFTYTQNGRTHFLLFDDAQTMRRKLEAAEKLGIATACVMYPEVEDILPKLF
ncbi:MAG: hypothetical protein IJA73_02795, partial [Oscillospiraceae bacterium]|nr:hypothetical protein [Oscillospiraceae bacterium]